MTKTIEQLRWLGNYLAADAESKGIGQGSEGARYCWSAASEIEQLQARVAELEAAHAAAVLHAKQLREALEDTFFFLERHSNRWDGVNGKHPQAVAESAREALSTPISTEALDKYVAEKVKEAMK